VLLRDWFRLAAFAAVPGLIVPTFAQRDLSGSARNKLALERLQVLGSVLMIAAHPDDENTALLAAFARGRKVRAGYLSITRGEGGQNLIGPEQGDLMGVIRTQELLAARRIDGAEQFFTRAIDFGFSKTSEETIRFWGREETLADIVWVIRRFRPDVIIMRFSGTARDGHGHHASSSILGKEAFTAAADPKRFPEQLRTVEPWQAKRVLFNVFSFSAEQERAAAQMPARVEIDSGEFDPVLGYSYGEIAGMSRSQHRSQGFGASERKGPLRNFLTTIAGEPAVKDVFDGIDISWNRIPGGAPVVPLLAEASRVYNPLHPERSVEVLLKARAVMASLPNPLAKLKLAELDETVASLCGLWLDAAAASNTSIPGAPLKVTLTAINRSHVPLALDGPDLSGPLPYNQPLSKAIVIDVPASRPYSQPFWLRSPKNGARYSIPEQELIGAADQPPEFTVRFRIRAGDQRLEFTRSVIYRRVDRVLGELTRAVLLVPPVSVLISEPHILFPNGAARKVEIVVQAQQPGASGELRVAVPGGWKADPSTRPFQLASAGEQAVIPVTITPGVGRGELSAVAVTGGREVNTGFRVIEYPHIPPQAVFTPSRVPLIRAEVKTLARSVGYVMGAGDDIPDALRQMGCDVRTLSADDLARADLAVFDAVVTGVRAFNTRPDLRANMQRLLDYVRQGGTMVVQYNVLEGGFLAGDPAALSRTGPYPIRISRGRVTEEDAPVSFPAAHPLLNAPNKITPADFEGWVQERGLYFASDWDPRYESLLQSGDSGDSPLAGGTLYTRYGKGAYIFTGYSWFRQLPAGVPGAFRVFANFLSAGKVPQ
jgi:LmbE family N-acetylglucosaminyl deacetylase